MPDNKTFSSYLDRRITIQKPTEARNLNTNERQTGFVDVFSKLPARKMDRATDQEEGLEGKALRAEVEIEWETRYLGHTIPRADWRLIDESGNIYLIIAPPTEIQRRKGWRYKTRLLQ